MNSAFPQIKHRDHYDMSLHRCEGHLPRHPAQKISGAEIFVKSLEHEKVETIFGYPGGVVLPIYDQLFMNSSIRHILTRHEQGGTHAADGYARATGKVGVVLVTSGPGATNTITGIATAHSDSIPLVVFTGQVSSAVIGTEAFQEAAITSMVRSVTKHCFLVRDVTQLADTIHTAFHIARTGRPGPVLIDMPVDMLRSETWYSIPHLLPLRGYRPLRQPLNLNEQIQRAARLIADAQRPVLYCGGGVISAQATAELYQLAMKIDAPVTTTLLGLGSFPQDHEQALGMLGMHGTWYANMAVSECDLLIACGARFDDRITGRISDFSKKSKKIHIDIDDCCVNRNVAVDLPIIGDAKAVLRELVSRVGNQQHNAWRECISRWKKEHPLRYDTTNAESIKPQAVLETVSKMTHGEAMVVTDVGQHQMWTAQYYQFRHARSIISSGGLGTMGYGLPAAIGAALGQKQRPVICICGDGGFQMTSMELATAVAYKIPIKVIIINNGYLGMVRQWQELFYNKHYSHTTLAEVSPDFVKLAQSYGARAFKISKKSELQNTVAVMLEEKDVPVVVDINVDAGENVYPMVPPGKALYEMTEGG